MTHDLIHIARRTLFGIWYIIQFIAAFLYYLLTEIFVDPFIIVKPVKITAKWLYDNCPRLPVAGLYFTHLVNPQGRRPAFVWASRQPWIVAVPPGIVVALTVAVKYLALTLALHAPIIATTIFVSAKITFVPISLRMWDEARHVVRKDFILRQVDTVVHFAFHILPIYARDLVKARIAEMKRHLAPYLAPIRERVRTLTRPVREALRPWAARAKAAVRAWTAAARAVLRSFFSRI